jgi:hypothetical protein
MSDERLWEDAGTIFRPSYAPTWLNCAGSLRASMGRADTAGFYAAEGTVFHWLVAEWLSQDRRPDWLGQVLDVEKEDGSETFHIPVDEEMFEEAEKCITYSRQFEGERFVETKIDISSVTPIAGQSGTSDLAFLSPGRLVIIDWKYGRGVQVFAERNDQELLYAWGWFSKYDRQHCFDEIEIHIVQPRLNHFDAWMIGRDELIEWAEGAKERATEAWKRKAPRTPSPKACTFCKASVDCAAKEVLLDGIVDETFDFEQPVTVEQMQTQALVKRVTPQLPDPTTLSTDRLAKIARYRRMMEGWFKQIHEELLSRGESDAGEREILADNGWKITEGRTHRRWKDEQLAVEKLTALGLDDEQIRESRLISPSKTEKLLPRIGVKGAVAKAFVATLAIRPRGKPTLTPTGDARLELPNVVDSFDDDEAAL